MPSARYEQMVLEAYKIPHRYSIAAAVVSWILLAGFIIFPGTYTSLQESQILDGTEAGKVAARVIQNIPLMGLAITCCTIGSLGISVVWWLFRDNYVWLNDHIFL